MGASKEQIKKKVYHELSLFLFYFIFLTLVLWTFTIYRRLILDEYRVSYVHYGYNFVEAIILAKMILIGQNFKLGERFSDQPLIIPTIYKTLIFSIFITLFTIVEEFVIGYFKGVSFEKIFKEFMEIGWDEILAKGLVMFFVFIFFFAFLEIGRVMGENQLINLFIHKREKNFKN